MVKLTKLEKTIVEAIKTARLGLPDWHALAKSEGISYDYVQQRVEWLRRAGKPARLMEIASRLPRAKSPVLQALEMLA